MDNLVKNNGKIERFAWVVIGWHKIATIIWAINVAKIVSFYQRTVTTVLVMGRERNNIEAKLQGNFC